MGAMSDAAIHTETHRSPTRLLRFDSFFGQLLDGESALVDIAEELVSLITAQRYFQANAKAIDTATQISQTVINLRT